MPSHKMKRKKTTRIRTSSSSVAYKVLALRDKNNDVVVCVFAYEQQFGNNQQHPLGRGRKLNGSSGSLRLNVPEDIVLDRITST